MHTTGPWTIEVDHSCDEPEFIRAQFDGEMFDIATLSNESGNVRFNARLIAAAPDMLAALQLIYANAGESPEWIRSRIDAVIARATGGQ